MNEPRNSPAEKLRIAVTGASGLIGRQLLITLRDAGHEGVSLTRHLSDNYWNVLTGEIRTPAPVDAVVHLAGRQVWSNTRWTKKVRQQIWDSRIPATQKLAAFLARMNPRPRTLISASGIGAYGSRGDEILTETSPLASPKATFLSDVCRAWEDATKPAQDAGIRVVNLRIGVVLSPHGGALAKMIGPTKWFLASPVGPGTQFISWISLTDITRLLVATLLDHSLAGPVNAVAPHPVRQHEFIRTLANLLHRPAVVPLPSPIIKLLFGQMGKEALLMSQRVSPTRLPAGFNFRYPTLGAALHGEMKASGAPSEPRP